MTTTAIETIGSRRAGTRAPAAAPLSACAIQPRVFISHRQKMGNPEVQPLHLETIRDTLARQVQLQDPRDLMRSPSQLSIRWRADTDRATLHALGGLPDWVGDDVAEDGGLVFSATGLRGYLREVLPTRGAGFLDALGEADRSGGTKMATLATALLAKDNTRILQLRTVRTKDPATGRPVRAVRGVFRGYSAFDDLEVLDCLLACQTTRELPVISYRRGDDGMRVRFALGSVELNRPTPVFDVWNSETGRRALGLCGGTFKLVCLNGMSRWKRGETVTWRHVGNTERIRDGLPQAVAEVQHRAEGLVDRYNEAILVAIDDAAAWLEAQLSGVVGAATIKAAQEALDHPTVTPDRMLASTIDAVTWIAQQEADQFRQHDLEAVAVGLLDKGLQQAREGRIIAEA